jgi:hypothetical protein
MKNTMRAAEVSKKSCSFNLRLTSAGM